MAYLFVAICVILAVLVIVVMILSRIRENRQAAKIKQLSTKIEKTSLTDAERSRLKVRVEEFYRVKREEDARRNDELIRGNTERWVEFTGSVDYTLIKDFAKKFGKNGTEVEFSKLQILLRRRGREFREHELSDFVYGAYLEKLDKYLLEYVFKEEPGTLDQVIRIFLERANPDDFDMLTRFTDLLEKHGFYEIDTHEELASSESLLLNRIETVKNEIELENFERRLSKGDEQVQLENIDLLDGVEFEGLLAMLFSKMGYAVEQTPLTGDQGADLILSKFAERTVVQAKRVSGSVGNSAVQEISAAISIYQAQKGVVVTNRHFTQAALELATANGIELIDRDGLEDLINTYW
jgi:HJR/Mrr/RecB family endonuclease